VDGFWQSLLANNYHDSLNPVLSAQPTGPNLRRQSNGPKDWIKSSTDDNVIKSELFGSSVATHYLQWLNPANTTQISFN